MRRYRPMVEEYELLESGQVSNIIPTNSSNKFIGSLIGGLITGTSLGGPVGALIGFKVGLVTGIIGFIAGYGVMTAKDDIIYY